MYIFVYNALRNEVNICTGPVHSRCVYRYCRVECSTVGPQALSPAVCSIFICIYSPGSVYICVCNTVHNAMYRDYPTWQTGTVVEYSVSFYSRSLKPVPGVCLVTDKDPHG